MSPSASGRGVARVLVVDDESGVLIVLREHLEREGYDVATAASGVAALSAFSAHPADVVLLDLNMPGALDGHAVLGAIGNRVPVIVVTAVIDLTEARATLKGGAFDFIAKPFDLERVSELVAAAVAYQHP